MDAGLRACIATQGICGQGQPGRLSGGRPRLRPLACARLRGMNRGPRAFVRTFRLADADADADAADAAATDADADADADVSVQETCVAVPSRILASAVIHGQESLEPVRMKGVQRM
jgi:hypothetical protein